MQDLDAALALRRQELTQGRRIDRDVDDDPRGCGALEIMLCEKSLQGVRLLVRIRILRKKALVAEMSSSADHDEIHRHHAACGYTRNDIRIHACAAVDELLFLHLAQRLDLIA